MNSRDRSGATSGATSDPSRQIQPTHADIDDVALVDGDDVHETVPDIDDEADSAATSVVGQNGLHRYEESTRLELLEKYLMAIKWLGI